MAQALHRTSALVNAEVLPSLDDALFWLEERQFAGLSLEAEGSGTFTGALAQEQRLPDGSTFEFRRISAGSAVLTEGEPSESMLCLQGGTMTLIRQINSGGQMRVARLVPGAILSEIGFLAGLPRSASASSEIG